MDNYAFERMELYVEKSTIPLHKKKVQKFIIKPEDLDKNTYGESEDYRRYSVSNDTLYCMG